MQSQSPDQSLIAPCGMNCGLCLAYLRPKNSCHGCRMSYMNKPVTRMKCKIKNCEFFSDGKHKFCFECDKFPCEKVKHLDNRYRSKYHMSMIENLFELKTFGMDKFLHNQKTKWSCPCGGVICVHSYKCIICGKSPGEAT